MFQSQSKISKFILVKIMMPPKNIEVQVPAHWKVNKLKCLIIKKVPVLKFDDFQLLCPQKAQILNGDLSLSNYAQRILKLGVIQKNRKEFGNYYCESVKKLLFRVYSEQVEQQGTAFMLKMPVLNKNFQKAHLLYSGFSQEQAMAAGQQRNQNANQEQQQQNQFRFLDVLWVLSIPFIINLLTTYLSWQKTFVLLIAVSLYLFMHYHVRRNANRREQREPQPAAPNNQQRRQPRNNQNNINNINNTNNINNINNRNNLNEENNHTQKEQNQLKKQQQNNISDNQEQNKTKNQEYPTQKKETNNFGAVFLHIIFFIIEASYCFACSLFPNWTVDVHLAANRQYLTRMKNAILRLNPQYQFKQS